MSEGGTFMILQQHPFFKKKRISLPVIFIGFVSLSLLITLSITIFSFTQTQKKSLIDNTLVLNYSNATQMSQSMDILFESMQSSLKYAADVIGDSGESLDAKSLENQLELIRHSSNYFNSLAVINKNGLVSTISPKSIGTQGTYVTSNEMLKAINSQRPYISEVYTTKTTKRRIVFISEPIFNTKGEYQGIIGGTVYLQEANIINKMFGSQIKKDDPSYFYIVDSTGKLLYHPERDLIGVDISSNYIIKQLQEGKSGKQEYVDRQGMKSLVGFIKSPSTDWGIVVVSPTENIYQQLENHVKVLITNILFPILLLMLVVMWIARHLARPFVILANSIQQLEEGNIEIPDLHSHWNREADVLTRTVVGAIRNFQRQHDQLVYQAKTDVLTGLTNRRMFEETIQQWVAEQHPFAILMIDIDHFKVINDSYGHQTGDIVLQKVSSVIIQQVTENDVCSRFGGEEFVVMLSNANSRTAFLMGEQIRNAIQQTDMSLDHPITISVGIAVYPFHANSATELFHLADTALYQAKEEGRNKTVIVQSLDKEKN